MAYGGSICFGGLGSEIGDLRGREEAHAEHRGRPSATGSSLRYIEAQRQRLSYFNETAYSIRYIDSEKSMAL